MAIFGNIFEGIRQDAEEEKIKEGEISYWLKCPGCGKRVVKKELLSKGCYVCGWHEARHEAELTRIMRDSQVRNDSTSRKERAPWCRTNCPQCKAPVIRQELMERGCYICGWKPEAAKPG